MKIQITNGMLMALIINMVYSKAIGLTQGTMAREVGSDMWIATAFSTIQGILFMLLTVMAIKRMPNKNIFEQLDVLAGKFVGKIISFILFLFFLFGFGGILSTFVFHLKDFFLPDAPVLLFVIVAMAMGAYALYYGLEVIARMALIGVFSIIALNILVLLGSFSKFDIRELLPVFDSGFVNTLWASRHHNADWSLATMMTAVILSYVRDSSTWTKSSVLGLAFGGLFIVMWPILEAGVLSSEVTAQYFVSCMQLARSASIGYFIQRYEMIMIAFFALSGLTQIMMSLLCASISLQHMLGMKDYRKLIIPVSIMIGAFGYFIVLDHHRAMVFLETYWVAIAIPVAVLVPLLLLMLGVLRKGKMKQAKQESF